MPGTIPRGQGRALELCLCELRQFGHQLDPQDPAALARAGHGAGLPQLLEISHSWHHGETQNHIKASLGGAKG